MQEAMNPPSERRAQSRYVPGRISTLVVLLALALISIASVSLVYVGRIAAGVADAQAQGNEDRLFANALHDKKVMMAREQLALARWTKSYRNISQRFSQGYIRKELVDWIWNDYRHDRTSLVGEGGKLLMTAREDKADFAARTLATDDPVAMIVTRAVARFMSNREPMPGGFRQKRISVAQVDAITDFAFATIDGEPALVSAMAVVPDDDEAIAMPDGAPVILVSAKFLRGEFSAELNAQLAFKDFTFDANTGTASAGQSVLEGIDGRLIGAFRWTRAQPGAEIWSVVIPVIGVLAAVLALSAGLIARGIARISTRLEASEARNRQLALHDALTGLANRLHFNQSLDAAVGRLPHLPFAVLACDLDRFKAVNDTYGHAAGDTVIRIVAERLATVVGGAGLVGRPGGDEFLILVTGFTDQPRLRVLTHQIIASVSMPITLDDGAITDVGASIGVAVAPDHGASAAAILASADAALYGAKERGRGIAVFAQHLTQYTTPEQAGGVASNVA
ncbi:MAG: diguanylate [Beijerinckiaceae bacterium]|nr:MAG: diguanylate [Beijerinckiaceae bacterium]